MATIWAGARLGLLLPIALFSACASLVAPYDATFDQSLNKLSEETARFLAAAESGGSERSFASEETVAYYATTYNVLDRLIERARLTRGSVPCATDRELAAFAGQPTSRTSLPEDYLKLDCREFQLYGVRLYANQLEYAHQTGGVLNRPEAKAQGGTLQAAIMAAILTFVANKPVS
ncbi:MAG: hypothetical protein JNL61_15700 [Rhizobiaceae bacterium]|nr:hypothetical protein [Rhizobiaceae bacterium]